MREKRGKTIEEALQALEADKGDDTLNQYHKRCHPKKKKPTVSTAGSSTTT
jgi:hypothetical protein